MENKIFRTRHGYFFNVSICQYICQYIYIYIYFYFFNKKNMRRKEWFFFQVNLIQCWDSGQWNWSPLLGLSRGKLGEEKGWGGVTGNTNVLFSTVQYNLFGPYLGSRWSRALFSTNWPLFRLEMVQGPFLHWLADTVGPTHLKGPRVYRKPKIFWRNREKLIFTIKKTLKPNFMSSYITLEMHFL